MKNDPAHLETEKKLEALERKISKAYEQAIKEIEAKIADYMRRFELKDKKWQEWVRDGKKTQIEYDHWRVGQIAVGDLWVKKRDELAKDFHEANLTAAKIRNEAMPEIAGLNYEYARYEAEHLSRVDTFFTMQDRNAIERLFADDPKMLPEPGKNTSKRIKEGKDIRWNNQQIQSVMVQSLLQGESIPKIATRLAKTVGDKNRKAAIRNARTMTTGAENAGRVKGYEKAKEKGIDLMQQWVATLDNRTRHSHRMVDGESVEVGEMFSNGCRFPGDPLAPPEETYNCRCCVVAALNMMDNDKNKMHGDLADMSYEEWKREKKSTSIPITAEADAGKRIKGSYINEYRNGPSQNSLFGAIIKPNYKTDRLSPEDYALAKQLWHEFKEIKMDAKERE